MKRKQYLLNGYKTIQNTKYKIQNSKQFKTIQNNSK